jgi:uroporphyrinogen-III synthase
LGLQPDGDGGRRVAVIGPVTAAACDRLRLRVDARAQPHTIEGLAAALEALPDDPSPGEVAR